MASRPVQRRAALLPCGVSAYLAVFVRKLPKTCKTCNLCYTDGGKRETRRRLSASAKRFSASVGAEGRSSFARRAEPCKGRICPRVPFKSLFACKKRLLLKKQCGGGLRPPHAVLFSPQSRRANFARRLLACPRELCGRRAGGFFRGCAAADNGEGGGYGQADMGGRGAFFFTNMPYPPCIFGKFVV